MKVLSIRQPWAWLIVNGFKDIENRTWPTKFRGEVLIHAGKVMTDGEYLSALDFCEEIGGPSLPPSNHMGRGGIVGIAEIVDCVKQSDSPWFVGDFGFVLRNKRPLPFYPLRGQLGFFDAPTDFEVTA